VIHGDDAQASISLDDFPDGDAVQAAIDQQKKSGKSSWKELAAPPIRFAVDAANAIIPIDVVENGQSLNMGLLRTPVAAFSSGTDFFAVFFRAIPVNCAQAEPKCPDHYTCDTALGTTFGSTDSILTTCTSGKIGCVVDQGICQDRSSSVYDDTDQGRYQSIVVEQQVGIADTNANNRYQSQPWPTNKFLNLSVRVVNAFDATTGKVDHGAPDGVDDKVLVWGRPNFAGTKANGRDLALYFMYVDMPQRRAAGGFAWEPHYLSGLSGDPATETWDIVGQMTINWFEPLGRWVMFYGGDTRPAPLALILGDNNQALFDPQGAIHARFAADPFGPWSHPTQVLKARNRAGQLPIAAIPSALFGILWNPDCSDPACAPNSAYPASNDLGVLYGPNFIAPWTRSRPGAVDIFWNVSTWNPYSVVLLKTTLTSPK
jgi:hypothetical protein